MLRFVCVVDTPRDLVCGGGEWWWCGGRGEEGKRAGASDVLCVDEERKISRPVFCPRTGHLPLAPTCHTALARPALAPALRAHRHGRLELPPPSIPHTFIHEHHPSSLGLLCSYHNQNHHNHSRTGSITSARGSSMSRSCLSFLCVPISRLSLQRCAPFLGLPAASYHCSQQ